MKPSEIIGEGYKQSWRENKTCEILDQMATDIKQIKFLIKYICPEDVLNVHKLEKRKWEE